MQFIAYYLELHSNNRIDKGFRILNCQRILSSRLVHLAVSHLRFNIGSVNAELV